MTSAAASLGQRLLDEIKEESLDEVRFFSILRTPSKLTLR